MRSKKVEFYMPWPIYEAAIADAERLGFDNIARYFLGLTIKALLSQKRVEAFAIIANSKPKRQDFLLHCLELYMQDAQTFIKAVEAVCAASPENDPRNLQKAAAEKWLKELIGPTNGRQRVPRKGGRAALHER